jgi:methionyl-tRNA formyltransferase
MRIQLLTSNKDSWIVPYGLILQNEIILRGHMCEYLFEEDEVEEGDILVFLSYEKLFRKLSLNQHNLVIHESDLPKGKGMSPLTWQVLEGKNLIPITLLEATKEVDAGNIYKQRFLDLRGDELNPELKHLQGQATIDLVLWFLDNYPNSANGKPQLGDSTFYSRRSAKDSELNVDLSIREQFNLLRVCDNERFPAFFYMNSHKYILKIEKVNNE